MSTATATAYRNNCTGRFMSSRIRKSPQNKAFYGHKGTYSGKAHCIKDRVLLERCRIDSTSGTVTYLPSREDSYERLLEGNKQFPSDDEDVDDAAIKAVMIEKMLTCLKRLSPEKQKLITALFFDNKSEHQVSRETGVPQRTIHDRKIKILAKLKRLMNE